MDAAIGVSNESPVLLDRFLDLATEVDVAEAKLLRQVDDDRVLVALDGVGPGVSDPLVAEQVEIEVRYSGYLDRQKLDIERHDGFCT